MIEWETRLSGVTTAFALDVNPSDWPEWIQVPHANGRIQMHLDKVAPTHAVYVCHGIYPIILKVSVA